jgi:hypothetical protein
MPFLTTSITSGDRIPANSPAARPCLILASALAIVGACYAFDPGQDPRTTLGYGMGTDELLYLLRNSGGSRVVVAVAAATWSAAPSVVKSGSGPTVTCALGAGQPGCLDDHRIILTITSGGILGAAQASLAYDGGEGQETFTVPAEGAAITRGLLDITDGADVEGLTLLFTAPAPGGSIAFGAGSLAGAAAGLKVATATVAAPVTLSPSDMLTAGKTALSAGPRRLIFTTAGATASDAPATATITGIGPDGNAYGAAEVLNLSQTAGSVTTVRPYKSIINIVYSAADGTGATIAIGYSSRFATAAELAAAFDVLAIAEPLAVRARVAEVGTAQYLELYTTAVGASASIDITGSDAPIETATGLDISEVATGTAATYAVPLSGLVLTFPAGTYVADETYTMACTGPRMSNAQVLAARTAAIAQYSTNPFGFFCIAQPASSGASAKSLIDSLEAARLLDLNATVTRDWYAVVGGPWHTASAVAATSTANIASADQALVAAFGSAAASANSVAVDDIYLPGSSLLAPGSFRRSAAIGWAAKRAAVNRLAATVAEGTVPEAQLLAADGLTAARDQNTAVTHLEGLQGLGFFVLKSADDSGAVKFDLGATRAGSTSRLQHDGDFAVCAETARKLQELCRGWEAQRPEVDTTTGMMTEGSKSSYRAMADATVRPFLRPESTEDSAALPNCSDFDVQISNPSDGSLFTNSGKAPLKCTVYVLGTVQAVSIDISATGTTIAPATTGA